MKMIKMHPNVRVIIQHWYGGFFGRAFRSEFIETCVLRPVAVPAPVEKDPSDEEMFWDSLEKYTTLEEGIQNSSWLGK